MENNSQPALFQQPRNFIGVIWTGLWLLYRNFSPTIFVIAILAEIVRYYCLLNFGLHVSSALGTTPPATPAPTVVLGSMLIHTAIYIFSYTLLFLCLKDKLLNSKITLTTQLLVTAKKFFPVLFLVAIISFTLGLSVMLVGFVAGLIGAMVNNVELSKSIAIILSGLTFVILAIYLSQSYNAFVLNASSCLGALKYSYKLVKHAWWHVFFLYVAMSCILMPMVSGLNFWLYGIIQEPFFLGYVMPEVNEVVLGINFVIKAILTLVSVSMLLAVFYNLRVKKIARAGKD